VTSPGLTAPRRSGGGDAKLAAVLEHWFPRFIANGLDYLDVRRTLDGIETWDDWPGAWSAAAEEYERLGRAALDAGRTATAGEHLRRAALTLQFAQFVITEDEATRGALHRRQAEIYAAAAPLQRPPAHRITVPFAGAELPGYLRRPRDAPAPGLVVLVPGLESTKEQFSTYEPYFLDRGVATLSFEGPGQGEAWEALAFRDADYRDGFAALGRTVGALDGIDAGRVVVLGTSFGGYLALRCATRMPGLAGVVDIAGPYDLDGLAELDPVVQDGFARLVKARDRAASRELLRDVSLDGALDDLAVPVLVVHGARDRVMPPAHARRIAAALGERAELWLEPEGNHSCNNLHTRVRPAVADWVAERLEAAR
jgi:dipeptidyl aminopeptidase/acylaminoacyl peptidase